MCCLVWYGRLNQMQKVQGPRHLSHELGAFNIRFAKTLRTEAPWRGRPRQNSCLLHLQKHRRDRSAIRYDCPPAADESSGIYMTPNRIFSTDDSPVVRLQARPHLVLSIRTRERFTVHDFVANFDAQPSGPSTLRPTLELCFRPLTSAIQHECKKLFKPA